MTGVETALAIAAASTAVGTGASILGAQQQNRAVRRSIESTRRAGQIQEQQTSKQASQELERIRRERDQIVGRLRVAAGQAGTVTSATSFGDLTMQTGTDASINSQIVMENFQSQIDAIRTGTQANVDSAASRYRNPLLDTISGGFQGLSTGLQIGTAGISLNRSMKEVG